MAVRGRTIGVVALLGAVVVAAGVATVLWLGGFLDRPAAATPRSAPGLDQPHADRLAAGLASPRPATVAGVLAHDAATAYLAAPAPVVPAGATLALDASTFTVTGPADAAISGTVTQGATTTSIVLLLALENGQWRVLTSVPA